jgi:HEAT repeat protein
MSIDFDDRDRESVIRDLESSDEEVRRLAVERTGALALDESILLLIGALGDPGWRVRKAAVERLAACTETSRLADALIVALADGENPGRRNAAVESLVHCGPRVVPHLIEAAESSDADVRKFVSDTLAGVGDPRATESLIRLLEDPDPNVRAAAADALGAVGGDQAVQALKRSATRTDEDQLVRFSTLHALAALEVPLRARDLATVLNDTVLLPAGLGLLGRLDDEEAVELLLKGLSSDSRSAREAAMRSVLRLLARIDGACAEALAERIRETVASSDLAVTSAVERLGNADLSSRLTLIQFLGLVRAEEAVVPILLAGADEALSQLSLSTLEAMGELAEDVLDREWSRLDSGPRRDACVVLGRTRGERGGARLLDALDDLDPEVRTAAARSIGERRLGEGLTRLVYRLETAAAVDDFESEEEVIALTEALIALTKADPSGDCSITDQAIDLLRSRLEGAAEGVRLAIATVLGRIGRRKDSQLIALLLKDPGARVRRAAVDALARLEPGTAAEPLRLALGDESPSVRIAAAGALGASESEDVLDDLKRLADDEDLRVRAAAVRSIGLRFGRSTEESRRSAALSLLAASLEDDAPVALAALEALREIGGLGALDTAAALERGEPELVREAVRCIGAHADLDELELLIPLVSHSDWSVRAEAIQTLADRGLTKAVPAILRRLETEQDDFVREEMIRALRRLEV